MASPYLRTTPSVGAGPSEQVPRHGIARQSTTRPRDRHSHSVSPDPVADGKRRSRSPHTDDLSVGNRLRARHFTELRAVTRGVPRVGTVTKRPRAPLDQRREDSEIDTDAPTNEQVHGGSSSKLKRYKPTGKPPGLKSGSGARNSTAQVQQDAEYMADVDDFEEELINPTYATRMDLKDGTAGGDRSRRPVSLDQLIASVLESSSRDSIAQTLSPIIEYYQNIADRQQVPLAAATSTFRNSVANLTLHDVLTVFRGPFSDTLLSTLLAVEEPGNASACFAPVYTAEKWLNCSERSVPDRVANIFGDMCKALNAFTTETSKFPFSNVGNHATRRMLCMYNPTGSCWAALEVSYSSPSHQGKRVKLGEILVLDAITSSESNAMYEEARQELIPLMTLASLRPSSPFHGVLWDEDRCKLESNTEKSYSAVDSGPIGILTAVYRANDIDIPTSAESLSERMGLGRRVRLACAKRLSMLVQEKNSLPFVDHDLFTLLKLHLKSSLGTATPVKMSRRVTLAERNTILTKQKSSRSNNATSSKDTSIAVKDGSRAPGYEAFRLRDTYPCPFCASTFPTSHGRAAHVMNLHDRQGIPFPDDSSEDGSMKIKCPNSCGQMFRSYKKAKEHTSRICKNRPQGSYACPWKHIMACPKQVTQGGVGNHIRTHTKDVRGPYRCHLCGQYYADRYTLGGHVDDCKGTGAKTRNANMMRFLLSEDLDAIPGVILIIRSSSEPPHEWKAGFESLEEGLPVFGHMVLQQFRQMSGIRTPAVLHASWNMKTRELPATEALEDRFGDTEPHRNQKNNAFKWTNAITKDLKCATDPIIITGGWDGWTCNTQRLPAWLKRTPNARWFIRLTNLRYDEDECLLRKHGNLYWAEFDSVSIDQALRTTTGRNPAQNQLVRVWDQIQTSKDHRGGAGALFNGRNNLAIDLEDIEISTDG